MKLSDLERESLSISEEFRVQFYLPVLDKFLYELNTRFQDSNLVIMKGVSACTPTSLNFLSCIDLESFAEMYAVNITINEYFFLILAALALSIPDLNNLIILYIWCTIHQYSSTSIFFCIYTDI